MLHTAPTSAASRSQTLTHLSPASRFVISARSSATKAERFFALASPCLTSLSHCQHLRHRLCPLSARAAHRLSSFGMAIAMLVSTAVLEHFEAVLVMPRKYLFGGDASGDATLQLSMSALVADRFLRGDRVADFKVEVFDGDNMSKYQKAADGDVKMRGDGRKSFVLHPLAISRISFAPDSHFLRIEAAGGLVICLQKHGWAEPTASSREFRSDSDCFPSARTMLLLCLSPFSRLPIPSSHFGRITNISLSPSLPFLALLHLAGPVWSPMQPEVSYAKSTHVAQMHIDSVGVLLEKLRDALVACAPGGVTPTPFFAAKDGQAPVSQHKIVQGFGSKARMLVESGLMTDPEEAVQCLREHLGDVNAIMVGMWDESGGGASSACATLDVEQKRPGRATQTQAKPKTGGRGRLEKGQLTLFTSHNGFVGLGKAKGSRR